MSLTPPLPARGLDMEHASALLDSSQDVIAFSLDSE